MSRLNVYNFQLRNLYKWCQENNLYIEISNFFIEEHIVNEGKGMWSNFGKKNNITGLKYCYISQYKSEVLKAKNAEEYNNEYTHKVMGELLKIPSCCVDFYLKNRNIVTKKYFDEYATLINENTYCNKAIDWKLNYLSQYFGYSLIHHYPCSFDCKRTWNKANEVSFILKDYSEDLFNSFEYNMKGLMIVEDDKFIHKITGNKEKNKFLYHPADVKSTNYTQLTNYLKNNNTYYLNLNFQNSFNILYE